MLFEEILSAYKKLTFQNNQTAHFALILNSLITCYPPQFILAHLIEFIDFIKLINKEFVSEQGKTTPLAYPKYLLIKNISNSLNSFDHLFELDEDHRNKVFEDLWVMIRNLNSKSEYILCMKNFSEILAKSYSVGDINNLLGNIVSNFSENREFENYSSNLYAIFSKVIQFGSSRFHFSNFFSMPNLIAYLDLFHKETVKIDACKQIVETFITQFSTCGSSEHSEETEFQSETTSDPVILNLITYLCKMMHDYITALTLDDEKRQISTLIVGFIRRIYFNRDFEAQLNFYVDSRSNFSNLDHVLCFLVHRVNTLAMETHQIVNGHHTRKTISFVNACIAFSYITIPSIDDIPIRLQLYLSCSHITLINACLPQTDAFLKSVITLLRQLPSHYEGTDGKLYSNDDFLFNFISQVLSFLIVVPVSVFNNCLAKYNQSIIV